jgi:hypothetical protein
MCGVSWVSVERLFVLLPYVCGLVGVAGDAGGVMFRLLEHLFCLPTGGDPPPPPPINFCSPGFDYIMSVLLRGVIADLMGVNGLPALSQEVLLSRIGGIHPRWLLKVCVASGIRTRTWQPF